MQQLTADFSLDETIEKAKDGLMENPDFETEILSERKITLQGEYYKLSAEHTKAWNEPR